MLQISTEDIAARVRRDNPWWDPASQPIPEAIYSRRYYFQPFYDLACDFSFRRAPILLGPRRVGKTVIAKQTVAQFIQEGFDPQSILYASIDTPIYAGMALEKFISFLPNQSADSKVVIFDEIQYLANWEVHLKDLVDSYPNIRFIATGSAAAALRIKSKESGAGRFSEFILPPLTFQEFLSFIGEEHSLIEIIEEGERTLYKSKNIQQLNKRFVDYLNYGGYPEAVLNEHIRSNAEQFIKNDVIDKVLLKDLPSLYGIENIQELNKLFSVLAFNTGGEVSLENISQSSGLSKQTIKKYIDYLESAFLIMKIRTVDDNCRSMQRERNFKIYLNNPSMRAALFAPVKSDESDKIGHLAEAAIFSQWQHSPSYSNLRYARWKGGGEVDVVHLSRGEERPFWLGEIKWSDRVSSDFNNTTRHLARMLGKHKSIQETFLTTKTIHTDKELGGRPLRLVPSALYCYMVGRNITQSLSLEIQDVEVEVESEDKA